MLPVRAVQVLLPGPNPGPESAMPPRPNVKQRRAADAFCVINRYWVLGAGYWVSVTGYWLLVTGYLESVNLFQ